MARTGQAAPASVNVSCTETKDSCQAGLALNTRGLVNNICLDNISWCFCGFSFSRVSMDLVYSIACQQEI